MANVSERCGRHPIRAEAYTRGRLSMSWKPISYAGMSARVAEETVHLDGLTAQQWERCRVDPFQQAYLTRTAKAGEESVYVVARTDHGVVFFDDVEDEFGLAQIDDRGRVSRAVLCGELRWALTGTAADRRPSACPEPIEPLEDPGLRRREVRPCYWSERSLSTRSPSLCPLHLAEPERDRRPLPLRQYGVGSRCAH